MNNKDFTFNPFQAKGIETATDVDLHFLVKLNKHELLILEEALIPHLKYLRANFGFPKPNDDSGVEA